MRLVRYADEPDLREIRYEVLSQQTFPEYLQNNVPGNKYWGRLYEDFPDFQLGLGRRRRAGRRAALGADAVGRDG